MAYPLGNYMASLQDIVTEVKKIKREHRLLSDDEIMFLTRLSDLFDNISDEIRALIRDNTRH